MIPGEEYDPPGVASILPLRSKHAKDIKTELAVKIGEALRERNLIDRQVSFPDDGRQITIRLEEIVERHPSRRHAGHWIDGGNQVVGIHPETYVPFFINEMGSEICRLCDGKLSIGQMIEAMKAQWPSLPDGLLTEDLVSFLLLLEEMDLVEIKG